MKPLSMRWEEALLLLWASGWAGEECHDAFL
jgi:hypothetical protein